MDIVSRMLSERLDVEDEINKKPDIETQNPLTTQPGLGMELVTDADVEAFKAIENGIGLEVFSKIVLMKTAQKAMADHDELIDTMAKVDDKLAARMSEVAISALSASSDAAKTLMNYSMSKEKLEIEKTKLEIKSVTINNIGGDGTGAVMGGSQKEVLDSIKHMMTQDDEDTPPLIDV